ncbi:MAG: hypothetical protein B7Z45_10895, partial [Azorhizobium sp. 12-66-6]
MQMTRVFSIAPSAPFLVTLAHALLDGTLVPGFAPRGDPLALASATVYLPTRRAGRLFADALLEASGLPRIVPLGDVDEDTLAFSEEAPLLAPPRAVSPVHRRIALAALVERWRDALAAGIGQAAVAAGPSATVALADELASLFDQMMTAGVKWSRLESLALEEHDRFFGGVPQVIISDERGQLLETGGGVRKALPHFGDAPFLAINSDTIWIEGVRPNLLRLGDVFDPERMDALLLLASTAASVGYDGIGDFTMDPAGRLTRRAERSVAPFVYAGACVLTPSLFDGSPEGAFSLNRIFDRAAERDRK